MPTTLTPTCPTCTARTAAAAATPHLSPRELDVLRLTAQGLTREQIAARLWLSVSTVGCHQQSIRTRYGVHTLLEAVARALRAGIVD